LPGPRLRDAGVHPHDSTRRVINRNRPACDRGQRFRLNRSRPDQPGWKKSSFSSPRRDREPRHPDRSHLKARSSAMSSQHTSRARLVLFGGLAVVGGWFALAGAGQRRAPAGRTRRTKSVSGTEGIRGPARGPRRRSQGAGRLLRGVPVRRREGPSGPLDRRGRVHQRRRGELPRPGRSRKGVRRVLRQEPRQQARGRGRELVIGAQFWTTSASNSGPP